MMVNNKAIKIRESIVSGIFYPENKEELSALVDSCLNSGDAGHAYGIISPHASYSFSGLVAGKAFKAAALRNIETIIILAPLHTKEETDCIYLPESAEFLCPLGACAVHTDAIEELESCSTFFSIDDVPHLEEHSIELQLPFIKRLFPNALIVPIIIGSSKSVVLRSLASSIDLVFGSMREEVLIVATSNASSSTELDKSIEQASDISHAILHNDISLLINRLEKEEHPCGLSTIITLMSTAFLANTEVSLLGSADSNSSHDTEGESEVVQYRSFSWK